MKSVRRIAALILCAALVFSTGISAASYGGAKHETVSSADESGLAAALTQKSEKAEPAKAKKPGTLTECGGTCEYSPTVVIHGIGQSKTYLYENDEIAVDEDGKQITGWPIYANTKYIIKNLLWPLARCSSPSATTALSSHSERRSRVLSMSTLLTRTARMSMMSESRNIRRALQNARTKTKKRYTAMCR